MANLIPLSSSSLIKPKKSTIIKADKFLVPKIKSPSAIVKFSGRTSDTLGGGGALVGIEKKVVQIDKLLKDSLLLSKKEGEKKRVGEEQKDFESREKELEKNKPKPIPGIKLPSLPKMGFLDWIKNFVTQTILGFFAVRLIEHLPKLLSLLPAIIKVSDFVVGVGGKLLDGLISFVDFGYKAYDATRGFVKNLGGNELVKNFDKFAGALNTMMDVAVLAAISAATMGDGFGGDVAKDVARRGARGVFGRGGARAGTRLGLKVIGKDATKQVLRFIKPIAGRAPLIGGLLEFGISWALGDPIGKAAFKGVGATLLGAIGTAIGGPIGLAIGGLAGGELGGLLYDMFFSGKKPPNKVAKAAGGGSPSTRGGKLVSGPAKRTLKKKKKPRTLSFTPRKIKPGANTGGEAKVQQVFPDPEKAWWDPLGVFTGGNKQSQQPQQKSKGKTANPQQFLVGSNDVLGRAKFFGPFATIVLKSVLGQTPDDLDYKNAGKGLNAWVQTTFGGGTLGFAGGGEVDAKQYFGGEDYTDVIAKTIKESVTKEVDTTIRNLSKELALRPVGKDEMREENIRRGTEGGFEVGPAGSSGDKLTMARNLMRDLGLTASQAAGIVGNMAAESGVENARPQGSRPGTKAPLKVDGVTGYGLVQWTSKGRQQALADFARSKGADLSKPLSMDIEYQFFLKEFKGAYGNVLKQIKNAPDVKTSSTIFMQQYEIPAGYKTESKIMERYNMSKPIYDKLSRGEGKATEGRGTYISPAGISGTGKFKVVEYLTGDRNHPNFELRGHGLPSNYHDHIAFATIAEKEKAKSALRAAGIQIGSELRPGDPGYHGRNLAIDVPGGQWGGGPRDPITGAHYAGSRKVRSVLGIGQNAPRFHGGPILKTGNFFGHKGEYVIDKDSVDLFGIDFIDSINRVENHSQLITKAPSIIEKLKLISGYTDYENPESQIVYVEVPVEVPVLMPIGSGSGGVFVGGGVNNTVPGMEALNAIG
jgi:hypothetical protein